jgi:hypothetical protein
VTYAVVEDLKLSLSRKPAHFRNREGAKPKHTTKVRKLGGDEPKPVFKAKSINNVLTVLRRMLVIARKRGLIATVPEIDWLKVPPDEFDFLDSRRRTACLPPWMRSGARWFSWRSAPA